MPNRYSARSTDAVSPATGPGSSSNTRPGPAGLRPAGAMIESFRGRPVQAGLLRRGIPQRWAPEPW